MTATTTTRSSWFQRFLLPGLIFKGVVIGGGYATGRELAEFFLGSGPFGGLMGILLAMLVWSAVCAVTFLFSYRFSLYNYRDFFKGLLGPGWVVFEIAYLALLVLILAVVAAAAGTIGAEVFGLPQIVGTLFLVFAIAATASFGNAGVEHVFKYASSFIYLTYAVFLVLALSTFGDRIAPSLALDVPTTGWVMGGLTYASYNVVGAIAVLSFVTNFTRPRDAVIAGVVAGPLAMIPAIAFFLCMVAFYPEIANVALPSDFLLRRMEAPWLQIVFQLMIFCALLETGVGIITSLNERIAGVVETRGKRFTPPARLGVSAAVLLVCGFVAARVGLIDLIASGYGAFGYIMLAVFVVPLLTLGVAKVLRSRADAA
ncbi:hypothetical protein [Sphingosinicella microcystinivorans]|uniref:Membrane protein n=1 Tax=Sphingosinicella microcystinivorans TaxID=335406 RepID=A0AAD1D2I4_SPHMI|nr:hypothetical protein [Sphingosinicella microcystinivorans]RKS88922.1 putative membrane protein YkvI [Sphingosinicella microcystinivorans]BBE32677.1 membrane protein [Sphingosinicella microcystinivorans]